MKKTILLGLLILSNQVFGQWSGTGTNITTPATEVIVNNTKQSSATFWFSPTNTGPASSGNYYIKAYDYWGPTVHFQATGDNGNERMNITVDGKIGIGTTSPTVKAHISDNSTNILRLQSTTGGSGNSAGIDFSTFAGNTEKVARIEAIDQGYFNGDLAFLTDGDNTQNANVVERMRITHTGNVGIGTDTPTAKLEVYKYSDTSHLRLHTNQHAGIAKLEIAGGSAFLDSDPDNYSGWSIYHSWVNTGKDLYFRHGESGSPSFVLGDTGNVGIGTTTPSNKLDVAGTIRAEEVKVESTPWPDYVFSDTYQLNPLSEVSTYIQENHHLPGIPTAQEVAENGIKLGEMNAKLLEKVEELTLYLIEKDKEMDLMKKELRDLRMEVKELNNN